MRKACFLIFTVLLLFALAQIASAQGSVWQETRITGDGAYPSTPKIWQDTVYWRDQRSYQSGYEEIRAWDPTGGERAIAQVPMYSLLESIYQQKIVYQTYVSGNNYDLYSWDPSNGHIPITTAAGIQNNADIYGSENLVVVWEDHRGTTYSQIYVWDAVNGERILSPASANQTVPKIWGDRVVWQEDNPGGTEFKIYSYTPSEGRRFIGYGVSPGIWQDRVVGWKRAYYDKSDPYNWVFVPGSLWQWTPAGGLVNLAEHNWTTGIEYTDMWGTLVVANYGRAWDPVNGFTYNAVNYPSIYENNVAGVRSNNIYLETLVPEPSGLLALSSLAGALLLFKPKKRRNR